MSIDKLIQNRRSIRSFNNRKVSKEDLYKIIEAGLYAPSPKNRQPWDIVLCLDKTKELIVESLEKKLLEENSLYGSLKISLRAIRESSRLLFIYNSYSRIESDYNNRRWSADTQSIGAFIQNMLLKAESIDVKSLWICDIFYATDEINRILNTDYELVACIALGYNDTSNMPKRPRDHINNKLREI